MSSPHKVERATWEGPSWGRVELAGDWGDMQLPPIKLPGEMKGRLMLTRESSFEFAKHSGYAINGDWVSFVAPIYNAEEKLYLAGGFSGWAKAIGQKTWEMVPQEMGGKNWAILTVRRNVIENHRLFKFVNGQGLWREPPFDAPNVAYENNARNHCIDLAKTGGHAFRFEVEGKIDWRNLGNLVWREEGYEEAIQIWPGSGFYNQSSASPQGSLIESGRTRFRLFAPRATKVEVSYFREGEQEKRLFLSAEADGCWSTAVSQNLEGFSYYYTVEGPEWAHTSFDVHRKILDPWALAVRNGVGVVVSRERLKERAPAPFEPLEIENLIIAEAHVRDLLAKAPIDLSEQERKGFAGIKKFLDWPENPFSLMGINAIELQPIMEFDGDGEAYHWGYMPINFFSPASAYGSDKNQLTQITEVPQMVEAFHEKGIAVILDVVFNHMGVPAGPLFIDKAYYFRMNLDGGLTNWSGCGNDLRVESVMAERMALEALEHWVTAYGVDGFRFDLAELLGVNFLKKVEERLKKIKPGIILIAEPWSFKGHIGAALKETEFASWNDGFREFVPAFLEGRSDIHGLKYFLKGSVGGVAARPAQSVNYVESHDDFVWIDRITQNAAKNGYFPTLRDRRWTHLMASLVTMSLGVPMWVAGMEAMRSKYGVGNTYLRGDLNALDYERRKEFPTTVEFFRGLNNFRRGANGRSLRVRELRENYLRFFEVDRCNALAVLYNAEKEEAAKRILYAINPLPNPVKIRIDELDAKYWLQVADYERVNEAGLAFGRFDWRGGYLEVPPLSCGVWVEK